MKNFNPLLNETFVFRPLNVPVEGMIVTPSDFIPRHGLLRYADGNWIPDDGKPDLAFLEGVIAYGVSLPHSANILWQWEDIDLSRSFLPDEDLRRHHARGWHYQTINNTHWQDYRWGSFGKSRDEHPNEIAHKSAMDKCCSLHHLANGRGADLTIDNEWTRRGFLWIKSTMQPIKPPENPTCFLCLDNGKGHLLDALNLKKSSLEGEIEYSWEHHNKAEIDAIDSKDTAEIAEGQLKDIEEQIQALPEGEK
ncbi:hypothetical protein LCGC14_2381550 [marine sediment metagenome]|uniref:Uncharacterized protein n=1 Tax=marine sediment metagenome TaxID=412755 RepID=A0A0F9C0T5_9ZZZZ